jgi:hypothetical protein
VLLFKGLSQLYWLFDNVIGLGGIGDDVVCFGQLATPSFGTGGGDTRRIGCCMICL